MKRCFLFSMIIFILPARLPGAPASAVTQWGIIWIFDSEYEVGQFVIGDWWVVGNSVVITSITSDFDGTLNGWEVHPAVGDEYIKQGLNNLLIGVGLC